MAVSLPPDRKALFMFTTNATARGKWYFFLDESWPYAFGATDCSEKLAMARFVGEWVCKKASHDQVGHMTVM